MCVWKGEGGRKIEQNVAYILRGWPLTNYNKIKEKNRNTGEVQKVSREYYNPSINNNHINLSITLRYLQQDLQGLSKAHKNRSVFSTCNQLWPLWCINYQWFNKMLWQCLGDTVNPENNLTLVATKRGTFYG